MLSLDLHSALFLHAMTSERNTSLRRFSFCLSLCLCVFSPSLSGKQMWPCIGRDPDARFGKILFNRINCSGKSSLEH